MYKDIPYFTLMAFPKIMFEGRLVTLVTIDRFSWTLTECWQSLEQFADLVHQD